MERRAAGRRGTSQTLIGNITALTLLHNRRGKAPECRTVRLQWDEASQAAGIEDAHLHDLRAVAATRAEHQGKNPTELLAHISAQQTKRYLKGRAEVLVDGQATKKH